MKRKLGILHILCILSYLALIYIYYPTDLLQSASFWNNPHELSILCSYLLILPVFYLNYFRIVQLYFIPRKYVQFFLIVVVLFAAIYSISTHIDWAKILSFSPDNVQRSDFPMGPPPNSPAGPQFIPRHGREISRSLLLYLIGIFFTTLLRINKYTDELHAANYEGRYQYLNAKINPHFIFNTLNSIFALSMEERADKTGEAITKLSEIMRYITKESDAEKINLQTELDTIIRYIELQKIRFEDTVKVNYSFPHATQGAQIAPSLILPLVENAFKYGVNPEKISTIDIRAEMQDLIFHCTISNAIVKTVKENESTQLGLKNVLDRLNLIYPGKHTCFIKNDNGQFFIDLTIHLTY